MACFNATGTDVDGSDRLFNLVTVNLKYIRFTC